MILAQIDLTTGSIPKTLLRFAFPMICGNLLQQLYNVADTLIVGRFLGSDALGAVGSSYTLMTFLTSILLGLCMGSGALFSVCWGQRDLARLRRQTHAAFVLIAVCTVVLNAAAFLLLDAMKTLLSVPAEVWPLMRSYLFVIFFGIGGTFLYNYYASLLRAVGNSLVPLLFLAAAAVLNIALDLVFVLVCRWGVEGAAAATVLAQWLSGIGTAVYTLVRCPELRARREERRITGAMLRELLSASVLTCLQQSVMNLGILMVQGRINSFGPVIMAAFAAAVKIDSFAYMPLQDFGNAFSTSLDDIRGAELGRAAAGAHPPRHPHGRDPVVGLCRVRLGLRRAACCAAAGAVPAAGRDGDPAGRRDLPAHRGRVLCGHRRAVPALWLVPRRRQTGYVARADGHLARHARGAGLRAFGRPGHRRRGHLVVHPHRLGACGSHGRARLAARWAKVDRKFTPRRENALKSPVWCDMIGASFGKREALWIWNTTKTKNWK